MFENSALADSSVSAVVICQACGEPITGKMVRHHVIPKSLGGSDAPSNRVPRHPHCESVCHIIHPQGNPTRKQWGCFRKLKARLLGLVQVELTLKLHGRLAGLVLLVRKKRRDHRFITNQRLINLTKRT